MNEGSDCQMCCKTVMGVGMVVVVVVAHPK